MAKRRKKATRKRSRMSGTGGGNMTTMLTLVAGAVASRILTNKLGTKVNPKLLAGGQVAFALFAPKMIKNKTVQTLATGMGINSGVQLLQNFGVISAISGIGSDDIEVDAIGDDLSEIGYPDNLSTIADIDDDMSGMDDMDEISGDRLEILAGMDEMDY